jgi:hypothetical protein
VVFSMARVPLRTNFLRAARWWAEAQIFRPLASPRRPPATTGPHSKMPRETTSALIAAFRRLGGPKSSTCRVEITHGPGAHPAQRIRSPRLMRGLWIRYSHRGRRDFRTIDSIKNPDPSFAGPSMQTQLRPRLDRLLLIAAGRPRPSGHPAAAIRPGEEPSHPASAAPPPAGDDCPTVVGLHASNLEWLVRRRFR